MAKVGWPFCTKRVKCGLNFISCLDTYWTEEGFAIVHSRAKVIVSKGRGATWFVKVVLHASSDVLAQNGDVGVPIRSTLGVLHTQGMHQFMNHNSLLNAVGAQRNILGSSNLAHRRVATLTLDEPDVISRVASTSPVYKPRTVVTLLIITYLQWVLIHILDAGEVMKVLESLGNDQSLVFGKSGWNFIWHDPIWPQVAF